MGLNTINHPGQRLLTGLTALGSSQATAFPLVGGTAFHEFTTVAASTGAILPSSRLPITVTVSNAGANDLSVYPPVGGVIDGGSVNAAATLAAGDSGTYWAAGPLTWYSTTSASGGGGGGGSGTVTAVSVAAANGFTGTVATATTTPAITIIAGAITPTSISTSGGATIGGAVSASNLSGTNTGDAGTVTSVAVASANGYSGTVAAPTGAAIITIIPPTTGATITQANQVIPAPADGSTVTFDLSAGSTFHPAALGGNRTLALSSSPTTSPWARPFTIILTQGTGGQTVTWFTGIKWAGGSPPTLSVGAGAIDMFVFIQIASGSYLGQVAGQGYA